MYKVLLADDEPYAIEGLELLVDWEKRGFRIDKVCFNGEEAIEHIRRDPPDLVVTDIRMPILDGLALIEETRRSGNRSTLFVIASGYGDFDYARRALRLGVKYYLTKPIIGAEVDDVLERLQRELREREESRLIRDSADRYRTRHALSVLLFGAGEAERQEALRTLSDLPGRTAEWTYIHVVTEGADSAAARKAAELAAADRGRCYLVDCDRGAFGLVLGSDKHDLEGTRAFAERLHSDMRQEMEGRIGVAVGRAVDGLGELSEAFASAAEAERFLFFGGEDIVHYADIKDKTLSYDPGALKAAEAIAEAMEGGSPDALTEAIREAYRAFEQQMTLPELVGIFSTQAVLRCASVYKEFGGDPNELIRLSEADCFRQGRDLRASAEALTRFCLQCQAATGELKERQTGGTPAKVADYLRRNYTQTFTIKEIAERFYINPVYLGQTFSRKYGVGILDFIHDLRIEAAKRLLRDSDDASSAIAEAVGYRGYQHFLKQFERRLGMKPSDYRQQARQN